MDDRLKFEVLNFEVLLVRATGGRLCEPSCDLLNDMI